MKTEVFEGGGHSGKHVKFNIIPFPSHTAFVIPPPEGARRRDCVMGDVYTGEAATGFLGLAAEPGYERRMDSGMTGDRRLGMLSGLSQEQLAERYMQQQRAVQGAFSSSYNSEATTVAPVRRLVDRVGGESKGMHYPVSSYSSMHAAGQYVLRQEMPPFHSVMGESVLPSESVSAIAGGQGAEYMPVEAMTAYGVVPCDVLPRKAASLHDVWSGSNFCEEVAEMLRAHGGTKYFSRGVEPPRMHMFNRRGQPERDLDKRAGIGIALERHEASGAVSVKRIAADGGAAADGRLRVADVILAVDGIPAVGVGQELTNLIIGPEGTFVELMVERNSGEQESICIRRGAANPNLDTLDLPFTSYKSYQELPYYLSASDRENAAVEVSSRIAEMRKQILEKPDTPSSSILSMELLDHTADARGTFGVARRDQRAKAGACASTDAGAADRFVSGTGATSATSPKVLASGPGLSAGSPRAAAEVSPAQPALSASQPTPASATSVNGSAEAKIKEYEEAMKQVGSADSSESAGGSKKKKKK